MNISTIFLLNDEFSSVCVVCEFYLWVQVCEFLSHVQVHELCMWVCELCVWVHELCVQVRFVNFF